MAVQAVAIIPSKSFASVVRGIRDLPAPRLRNSSLQRHPNPSAKPLTVIESNVISSAARKRDYVSSFVILKRGQQRQYLPKKTMEGEFCETKITGSTSTNAADKEQQPTKEEEQPLKISSTASAATPDLAKVDEDIDSDDEKRRMWDRYFTSRAPALMASTPAVALVAPPPPNALPLPTFILKQ